RVRVLDEVVDLDDVRVLDVGQIAGLAASRLDRVLVAGVDQAFEHHPAVGHVVVLRQVDPAEAAVGQRAEHLVLATDQLAGLQLRLEVERGAALRALALGGAGLPVAAPADLRAAVAAETLVLRDHRILHHRGRRLAVGHRRHVDQAGAQAAATARSALGGRTAAGHRPAAGARAARAGPARAAGPGALGAGPLGTGALGASALRAGPLGTGARARALGPGRLAVDRAETARARHRHLRLRRRLCARRRGRDRTRLRGLHLQHAGD